MKFLTSEVLVKNTPSNAMTELKLHPRSPFFRE